MLTDFTVVDLETTGLDPATGRITEIAARRYRNGKPTAALTTLVWAGVEPEPEAVALNGLTTELLQRHGASERAALGCLFESMCFESTVLVAHNAAFEMAWLNAASLRLFRIPFQQDFLCTKTLAVALRAGSGISYSLKQLTTDYGIEWTGAAHRAMPDVVATKALLDCLIAQHEEVGVLAAAELINRVGVGSKDGAHYPLPAGLPAHVKEVKQ